MSTRIFEARLRQLLAVDKNARDLYSDLSNRTNDKEIKGRLTANAKEEKQHVVLEEHILLLLKR